MAEVLKRKKMLFLVVGILCLLVLGSVLLTNPLGSQGEKQSKSTDPGQGAYQADVLYEFKNLYVGNQVNVGSIIRNLPYASSTNGFTLQTENPPYGITVNYDFSSEPLDLTQAEDTLRNNAMVFLALIDNVEEINFYCRTASSQDLRLRYSRADFQQNYGELRDYGRSLELFTTLINSFQMKIVKPRSLEEAVSKAIKDQGKAYRDGEVVTEGHLILDQEEDDGVIKVYTLASVGWFAFENGIFTKISGSGAIPTLMTFRKNENGEYALLEYKEPMDGAGLTDSIKKMFPKKLWPQVLREGRAYPDLVQQQESQAEAYLKSIGRTAKVQADYVDKKLADIEVQASNKLFGEYTKHNSFLNTCPYWLGTLERVENGVRYIYQTSQSKTPDGYDVITFQKSKEDGSVVEKYAYKIVGTEPQLLSE